MRRAYPRLIQAGSREARKRKERCIGFFCKKCVTFRKPRVNRVISAAGNGFSGLERGFQRDDAGVLLAGVQPDFHILPEPLADVLRRATAPEASFRHRSVGEFAADFLRVCGLDIHSIDTSQPLTIESGVSNRQESAT